MAQEFEITIEDNNLLAMQIAESNLIKIEIADQINPLPYYTGEYLVTPSVTEQITLQTKQKSMSQNLVIDKIPFEQTSNPEGGTTIVIGGY